VLAREIRAFIDANNERCQPFTWTKTADQILVNATARVGEPDANGSRIEA
jgi:hypothetical protein